MLNGNGPLLASPIRMACLGVTVRGFSVPPFTVRGGESVCLHVPPSETPWHEGLLRALSGVVPIAGLKFHGTFEYLELPMPRRRWWGRVWNPPAPAWLIE